MAGSDSGVGVGSLAWANDYPHGDSTWPHSSRILNRILADCTPAERRAMTVENAIDLYRLPIDPHTLDVGGSNDGAPAHVR